MQVNEALARVLGYTEGKRDIYLEVCKDMNVPPDKVLLTILTDISAYIRQLIQMQA